ncbi:YgjV family protein [Geosporobacter ferrireducens]|uniref:N-acetyltransferase domain-containing protein n=1 Tax=Geosporobacter ferrireducens TaxID=1424294 RepID=A0A1D8GL30_9FIRM|nr:YgjV family protein [Geosporobacter ferrireducens]AOT71607.1 hypothetical protein Gferi_19955 [Geosporobacter ferrireducens]MTI55371.1 YgjV family protein [Geosporobacter ferrireducens]
MTDINWLEWLGYLASVLIAISLLMSSIVKLRLYNLVGSALFTVYGFSIGALPVGIINLFIFFINIYYLYKIYSEKEYFQILEIGKDDKYLQHFLDYYEKDIRRFFPEFQKNIGEKSIGFYILRNLLPAGIFIASHYNAETLWIDVDFAIPEYRDFKTGKYFFTERREVFLSKGYTKFYTHTINPVHRKYLKKMGFTESNVADQVILVKNI